MTDAAGPSSRRGGLTLIGRDRELAELAAGLEDALEGQERLFLIAGEPGIGKTRLAEQLARHAEERGARVVWGRCWEGGGAPPYWPWAQVVRAVAEGCDEATLRTWLGSGAAFVGQLAPDLGLRLGTASVGSAPSLESDATRFYLFEATASFLKRAAAGRPLMLVFDDLHAADDPSLLLLKYLARDRRGAPLLMVGTYRDIEAGRAPGVADALDDLVREGQLTSLRGLAHDDVRQLMGDLVGTLPPDDTVDALHETTEGNPLFIREAVRLLATNGTLTQPGRPQVPIPGSVRAIIQQRLAPLSVDAVQVLSAAAVVGRDFDQALVGPAAGRPAGQVLRAVAEAMALGIVIEDAGGPGRYRFSHSLMREVIYDTLPITVRTELHRAVGEAIERLYGADSESHVAALARHFAEAAGAGESARALTYARRAGDRAMQAYGYEDAVVEYRRALQALELSPERSGPDDALRCELLLSLGAALVRAGRYLDAKETHLQASGIARALGSPVLLARAALGYGEPYVEGGLVNRQLVGLLQDALDGLTTEDSPLRVRLLARLSVELTFSDESHRSDGLSQQAVLMARRLGDLPALGQALDARWMAVWGPDGLHERVGLAGEALELARRTGDRDLELMGRAQRVATSLESGDVYAVESDMALYGRLADELRMPVHQWTVTTMQAAKALLQGAFDDAEELANLALSLQSDLPNARWAHVNELTLLRWEQGRLGELRETWQPLVERFPRAGFARGWLALVEAERGNDEEARRALRLLAEQIPVRPRSGLWLTGFALAVLVAAHLNDAAAAERLYPVLRPYADHVVAMTMEHPVICLGSVSFYLGLLAAVTDRWNEAGEHFEAAIGAHERLGAAPLLARTRYEYARMLFRRGLPDDRARAVAHLDRAATTASMLGMAGLASQIERLRKGAASEVPAPAPMPKAIDAQAMDVLLTPVPQVSTLAPAAAVDGGAPRPGERDRFQREGEFWTVAFDGAVVRLRDSKGLRQIALLLAQPGREMTATDLEGLVGGAAEATATTAPRRSAYDEVSARSDFGDAGELLDAEARAAYKARLDELQEEIDEAEEFNDPERAERARGEREFLIRELARAVGLGGRDRKAASHAERARLNATRAIRAAMTNLAREHPSLGQHLSATIRTGRYCSYTPDPRTPVSWEL